MEQLWIETFGAVIAMPSPGELYFPMTLARQSRPVLRVLLLLEPSIGSFVE